MHGERREEAREREEKGNPLASPLFALSRRSSRRSLLSEHPEQANKRSFHPL